MLRLGSAALTNRRSATKVEVKVEVKAKVKVEILIIAQSAIRHPPSEIVYSFTFSINTTTCYRGT